MRTPLRHPNISPLHHSLTRDARVFPELKLHVEKTYESMGKLAADIIIAELRQKPNLLLCASAGGSPTPAYRSLAIHYSRQPKLFKKLRVLQIDEWGGLPWRHPATCEIDLRVKLLEPLRIATNRFVGFRSDAAKPEAECARVAEWLAANGPIDLCILGLGVNGHVAMNEPRQTSFPHAHVAHLADSSQNHSMLKGLPRKVRYGLTLGLGEILCSKKILLLVSGARKRAVLQKLLKPRVTPRFPASFLWLHPDASILCDREAAQVT